MTTTMREIAKKAGVSHTTVWRVLNGISSVKEETRKKVMEIAQKVGYDHPPMRGGVALRRVKNIRLLVFEFERLTRPLFIEVIRGIERVTRKSGYHLQFSSVEEELFFVHTKLGPLKETLPISGFILFGIDLTPEVPELFQKAVVSMEGEAISGEEKLIGSPHTYIKLSLPLKDFFHQVVEIGITRHWAIAWGEVKRELEKFVV